MSQALPSPGSGSTWPVPQDVVDWFDTHSVPNSYTTDQFQQLHLYLTNVDFNAIDQVVANAKAVAELAHSVARGLRSAQAVHSWKGSAANAFKAKVGTLPSVLDQAYDSYIGVSNYMGDWGLAVYHWYTKYTGLLDEIAHAKVAYTHAVSQSYGSQSAAMAVITPLQQADQTLFTNARNILIEVSEGLEDWYQKYIMPLYQNSPAFEAESSIDLNPIHWIEDAAKEIIDSVLGTVDAIKAYIDNPSLSTFADMAGDFATDAAIVSVLAAGGESLVAVLGGADSAGGKALLGALDDVKTASSQFSTIQGVEQGAAETFDGHPIEGLLSLTVAAFTTKAEDFAPSQVAQVGDRAHLLTEYANALAANHGNVNAALQGLGPQGSQEIQTLLGSSAGNPAAIASLSNQLNTALSTNASGSLSDSLKDFLTDSFVYDPGTQTLAGGH